MQTDIASGIEPVSRTYSSQGLTLHYLDWGTKGKPILLLVHGMMDHARSWDRQRSAPGLACDCAGPARSR